jgi:hypothetical protein
MARRNPALPRLAFQSTKTEARGALPWRDGLLLWGKSGLCNIPCTAHGERPAVGSADIGYVYALGTSLMPVLIVGLDDAGFSEVDVALDHAERFVVDVMLVPQLD